jgi:hypothetical protein
MSSFVMASDNLDPYIGPTRWDLFFCEFGYLIFLIGY